jgi:Fic family protein
MGDIYKLQRLAAQKTQEERDARDMAHSRGEDVAEGRQVITGLVLALKWQSSQYGDTLKMLVQDDRGFRVWGSVPSSLEVNREERVQFTATVQQSDKDPKFGFFKRPTKAVNLSSQEAAA